MIIQIVKFKSALSEDELMTTARERAGQFRSMPGLVQKYYVKFGQENHFGGIYVWDSEESLNAHRESELAATIPQACEVIGAPSVERIDAIFQLRE